MEITLKALDISFQANPSNSEEFWGLVQKSQWEADTCAVFHRCIDTMLVAAQIALHPDALEQGLRETHKALPFFVRWFWVRFLFVWQHWSILTALRIGERVVFYKDRSLLGLNLRAFLFGRFLHKVVILRGVA